MNLPKVVQARLKAKLYIDARKLENPEDFDMFHNQLLFAMPKVPLSKIPRAKNNDLELEANKLKIPPLYHRVYTYTERNNRDEPAIAPEKKAAKSHPKAAKSNPKAAKANPKAAKANPKVANANPKAAKANPKAAKANPKAAKAHPKAAKANPKAAKANLNAANKQGKVVGKMANIEVDPEDPEYNAINIDQLTVFTDDCSDYDDVDYTNLNNYEVKF